MQFESEAANITDSDTLREDAPPAPLLSPRQENPALDSSAEKHIQEQDKRLSAELSESIKICVWKADLTTFVADAVVSAANENLHHSGGLALALSKAGGPEIIAESDLHIRKYGRLKPETVITSAGNLPCKKLIHAVGPRVKPNPSPKVLSKAKKILKRTIENVLHEVTQHQFQSVAIPLWHIQLSFANVCRHYRVHFEGVQ